MIGDIIFSKFPYTDQPRFKERPSLVITPADKNGDLTVLKISSKCLDTQGRIKLAESDFEFGKLSRPSAVHLDGTTRINKKTVTHYVGRLTAEALQPILKQRICNDTRTFSKITHPQNRPGSDPQHPHNIGKDSSSGASGVSVPYAGRVFDEDEVEAAVSSTLDFWLTLGEHGEAMQEELAAVLGAKKCLLVNSGSSANLIAIAALTTHSSLRINEFSRVTKSSPAQLVFRQQWLQLSKMEQCLYLSIMIPPLAMHVWINSNLLMWKEKPKPLCLPIPWGILLSYAPS